MQNYIAYLKRLEFPLLIKENDLEIYMSYMLHDKKNENRQIRFVLLKQVAHPVLVTFSEEELKLLLEQFLKEFTKGGCLCH